MIPGEQSSGAATAATVPAADLLGQAKAAFENRRSAEARTLAKAVLAALPDSAVTAEAHNLLGILAIRAGAFADAVHAFRAAIAACAAAEPRYLFNLAMAFDRAGALQQAVESYRELVARFPAHGGGQRRLIKALLAMGKPKQALPLLTKLLSEGPPDPDLLTLAGIAHLELRRHASALEFLERALALRPGDVDAHRAAAAALMGLKRHEQAADHLGHMLANHPADIEARFLLAVALESLKRTAEAIGHYELCLNAPSRGDDACLHLAKLYQRSKRMPDAIRLLREVLSRRPRFTAAIEALAECLVEARRVEELETLIRNRLAEEAGPHIWNGLPIHLKTAGEREKAAELWREAARRYPAISVIAYNLGHLLNELSYAEEAELHLRRAIAIDVHYAKAWNALGVALEIQHRYSEAMIALDTATSLNPKLSSAWLNYGIAKRALNDFASAIAYFRKAIKCDGRNPVAHQNLAYTLLFVGEIEQGFTEYDWRWRVPDFPSSKRLYTHPVWDGRRLDRQGLIVWMEQGMGDEVMFSWYLPLVQRDVKRLIVDCDKRLIPTFERSFPGTEFIARDESVVHPKAVEPDVKYKAPAGHLPKFYFAATHDAIRETWHLANQRYVRTPGHLRPDPGRQAHWRRVLRERAGDRFTVGISWRSAVHTRMRDMQYPGPEQIARALGFDVAAINCQYSWNEDELALFERLGRERGFTFVHPPGIDLKNDLDDIFALVSVLDLVVSPLISLPWMAGAVGTPCWVLRTNETSRIWQQLGTPYVPWTPSMRLFFRHPLESWDRPVKHIYDELGSIAKAGPVTR
jgi:tetratricopeptide (TPR) repeat protein